MGSQGHGNEELREQLRVLGTNYDALLKELRSLPQPSAPNYVGDGLYECGNCHATLDGEWVHCPYCGSEIIWEVDA